jgi:exosortase
LRLALVNAALLIVAFGPIAFFDPEPAIEVGLEGAFFSPSDSSPAVVLAIAAWLLFRRWDRLVQLPIEGGRAWLAHGLLAAAAAVLTWSILVGAGDLRVIALMLTLQGLGYLYGGARAMRVLLAPTLFLLFVLPMPAPLLNVLITKMQFWTTDFAGFLLHAVGQSAFVIGETLIRENDKFKIIEACSGIRIMETLLMLSFLMLDLFRRSPLHSSLLLALTLPFAFLFNGFRAITLILNPHSAIVSIHMLQGIIMLLGGLLSLYAIDGLLERVLPAPKPSRETPERLAGGASLRGVSRNAWQGTGALALLASIALLVTPWPPLQRAADAELMSEFENLEGWAVSELDVETVFLGRIGMKTNIHRRYERPGESVDLYAAVGVRSNRARSVLFSKAHLLGSGWDTEDQGVVELAPEGITANWQIVKSLTRRYLVVSWHEHAGGLWEESARSLLGVGRSPLRRAGEAMTIRISTPLTSRSAEDHTQARERLEAFAARLRPILEDLDEVLRWGTD